MYFLIWLMHERWNILKNGILIFSTGTCLTSSRKSTWRTVVCDVH